MHTVVLDNEAIQSLLSPAHPKHRRAVTLIQVVTTRARRSTEGRVVVPTAVRVEAGWDRTTAAAAVVNRLGITDVALAGAEADTAAAIRSAVGVSVADAHIGACARAAAALGPVTILTSDPGDMAVVVGTAKVTIARL